MNTFLGGTVPWVFCGLDRTPRKTFRVFEAKTSTSFVFVLARSRFCACKSNSTPSPRVQRQTLEFRELFFWRQKTINKLGSAAYQTNSPRLWILLTVDSLQLPFALQLALLHLLGMEWAVKAIQINGDSLEAELVDVQVWWVGFTNPTREPYDSIRHLDEKVIGEAWRYRGQRHEFTGSRDIVPAGVYGTEPIAHQDEAFCTLMSLLNADIEFSEELADTLRRNGPYMALRTAASLLNSLPGSPCRLGLVAVQSTDLVEHLVAQTTGIYLVEVLEGTHCICWNADRNVILDPSPTLPNAIEISPKALQDLGYTSAVRAYAISRPTKPAKRRKLRKQAKILAHN